MVVAYEDELTRKLLPEHSFVVSVVFPKYSGRFDFDPVLDSMVAIPYDVDMSITSPYFFVSF